MSDRREITVTVDESLLSDFRRDVGAKRLGVERKTTTLEPNGVSVSVEGDSHEPGGRVPVDEEEVIQHVMWHLLRNNLDRLTVR